MNRPKNKFESGGQTPPQGGNKTSRRKFLKGLFTGAVIGAVTGALSERAQQSAEHKRFTKEFIGKTPEETVDLIINFIEHNIPVNNFFTKIKSQLRNQLLTSKRNTQHTIIISTPPYRIEINKIEENHFDVTISRHFGEREAPLPAPPFEESPPPPPTPPNETVPEENPGNRTASPQDQISKPLA